jgi:hypothetical protein
VFPCAQAFDIDNGRSAIAAIAIMNGRSKRTRHACAHVGPLLGPDLLDLFPRRFRRRQQSYRFLVVATKSAVMSEAGLTRTLGTGRE